MENQFQDLKKGSMAIDEYTNTFTYKIEFSLLILQHERSIIDRYAKGLPWESSDLVHQANALDKSIWVAKSIENMNKGRTSDKKSMWKKEFWQVLKQQQ